MSQMEVHLQQSRHHISLWCRRYCCDLAFTLVEVLAAMTVLILILGIVAQISGLMLKSSRLSRQEMDATQRARTVLDALSADVNNAVTEYGQSFLFRQDKSNNTEIAFVTRNRGSSAAPNSRFVAVDYRLNTSGQVIRSTAPVLWSDTDALQGISNAVAAADTAPIADSILRLQVIAILDNNKIVPLTQAGSWIGTTVNGQSLPSNLAGFSSLVMSNVPVESTNPRVKTMIVGIAALDPKAYALPNVLSMANRFASPLEGETPFDVWNQYISSGGFNSFPKPATASLRVFQVVLPVNQ